MVRTHYDPPLIFISNEVNDLSELQDLHSQTFEYATQGSKFLKLKSLILDSDLQMQLLVISD